MQSSQKRKKNKLNEQINRATVFIFVNNYTTDSLEFSFQKNVHYKTNYWYNMIAFKKKL